MRRIAQQRRFKLDLKRQKRRGKDIEELVATVEFLGACPSNQMDPRILKQMESEERLWRKLVVRRR